MSMDGLDLLKRTRWHDPVTAGGLNLTLHTALFRHSRESGNPEAIPGLNRGLPPVVGPGAPLSRYGIHTNCAA